MDQPGLDAGEHRQALDALRRVNRFSAGQYAVWQVVRAYCLARRRRGVVGPVRLLDVATGGGDLPVGLWSRARREGLELEAAGCDISPLALDYARERARGAGAAVHFFRHDATAGALPAGYDIVTSSLFLHHLGESDAVGLLAAMGGAGELALVDDLRRGVAGWALAYGGIRLLSRSKVARVDGPLSVEGAFTCDEARSLALEAGWRDFEVRKRWPCRFLMIGRRG